MGNISPTWILRHVVATVLTLLGGIGLVALAAALVAALAPDGARDLRAYETAARCTTVPSAPAECRWTQEFTVSGIRSTHIRKEMDRAFLTSADGDRWETFYPNHGPVLNHLHAGDQVTGTIWRGRLTEITARGTSQRTDDAPADMRTRSFIGALIMVPGGLLMAAACAWRLLRRRTAPAPTPGMVATLGLAFGLFFAGLISPLPLAVLLPGRGENFWLVAAVWLPIAAILTAVARNYVTRRRTSSAAAG